MKGNHPKRRKDKYNPYSIFESDGKYYIEFADGQRKEHCMEISRELYEAFDKFELDDLRHLNIVDRHIEQSEIYDITLHRRSGQRENLQRMRQSGRLLWKSFILPYPCCLQFRNAG